MQASECAACGYDPAVPVLLVAELSLPVSWPSQNQLGANARGNAGFRYRKNRQEFAAALHSALSRTDVARSLLRRRVWLRRVYRPGKRPYDVANLIGGGKAIVDVLVSRGLIVDDSPKWLEAIYAQVPGPQDSIDVRIFDVL